MTTLLILLVLAMLPIWALGMFGFICIFRAKKLPMDKSNRINHFRLVWFALTRPHEFVGQFPWLERDEWDNVNQ